MTTSCVSIITFAVAAILAAGCAATRSKGDAAGLILFVPGVSGDGSMYRNVIPALREAGDHRTIESFRWGAPGAFFFFNFNNVGIHERAERALAQRIVDYHAAHPAEPLDVIAHSAGGGVTLGALAQLPADVHVRRVVLLHPSVSPTYPLAASLARVEERLTLFHSDRDTTFLSWRTSNFGTYDNVKTKAAGNAGFDLSSLTAAERAKVTMHTFAPEDDHLGHDGGHFGPLAKPFLTQRVVPTVLSAP